MKLNRLIRKGLRYSKLPNYKLSTLLNQLYTSDSLDWLFDYYYAIRKFFKNIIKLIRFIPIVWKFENWDYGYILKFNYKLHKELYRGLYEEGHHLPSPKQKRALKAIIELYRRLEAEEYDRKQMEYLDKLYGPDEYYFKKVPGTESRPGGPYSTMHSRREDNMTTQQLKQYRALNKRLYKHSEYLRKQDLQLLGKLITKYADKFWD